MHSELQIARRWTTLRVMRVDADKRRDAIARITIDLVAREGLSAATFRRIAAEGGWSTASITNYFVDKQDLLVWTFQALSSEGERRFEDALDGAGDDPLPALLTMVPWCAANVRRWKAYLAFWDAGVRDTELASLLAASTGTGLDLLTRLMRRSCPAGTDCKAAAERLNAAVQGMALQILVDPDNWGVAKIRDILLETHRALCGDAARPLRLA